MSSSPFFKSNEKFSIPLILWVTNNLVPIKFNGTYVRGSFLLYEALISEKSLYKWCVSQSTKEIVSVLFCHKFSNIYGISSVLSGSKRNKMNKLTRLLKM